MKHRARHLAGVLPGKLRRTGIVALAVCFGCGVEASRTGAGHADVAKTLRAEEAVAKIESEANHAR